MKKTYILPAASTLALATEGLIAASEEKPISNTNGDQNLAPEKGWSSDDWGEK